MNASTPPPPPPVPPVTPPPVPLFARPGRGRRMLGWLGIGVGPLAFVVFLVAFALAVQQEAGAAHAVAKGIAVVSLVLLAGAVGMTLAALAGIPRYGRAGLLGKGLAGLGLQAMLLALGGTLWAHLDATRSEMKAAGASLVDRQLERDATAFNGKAPKMIDEATRLDKVESLGQHTLRYTYTVVSRKREELDLEVFERTIRQDLEERYRNDTGLAYFRRNKVTLVHHYNDKEGKLIAEIVVGPDVLGK